ncbi:MAG: TIGR04219 family outer membrane beta-barrel protein [Pseudomonadales bacterium]|nr:TIGR04219 family outer membrane beta-barrel protein [Pseudomonadales bacterium]
MKTLPLAMLTTTLACTSVQAAPAFNLYGGGYNWNSELEGSLASGGDDVDLDNDLGFDHASQSGAYLGLEHTVSLVPNVRVRYLDLNDRTSQRLPRDITFAGSNFTAGERTFSNLELEILDGTLYYSLPLDNTRLDLGLMVQDLDGELQVNSSGDTASQHIDKTLPLLHVAATWPFALISDNAYLGAEVNGMLYSDDSLADFTLRAGWRSDFLLGLEVGYNQRFIDLDEDSNTRTDLKFGGPYVALLLNF